MASGRNRPLKIFIDGSAGFPAKGLSAMTLSLHSQIHHHLTIEMRGARDKKG